MLVIPVIIGWIALGGAFDYFNITPKSIYQIFDYSAVNENKVFQPAPKTETAYKVTGTFKEALEFLGMDKALALKALGGGVPISGYGNYLSRYIDRSTTVEVLFLQEITTGLMTFPKSIQQGQGWQGLPQHRVGTHFVSDIEYGGQLFISVHLTADKPEHVEEVREAVVASIGQAGGSSERIFNQLQIVADSLFEKVVHISLGVYSTAAVVSMPKKISDLQQLADRHPTMVEKINEGKGAPLRIFLKDIHSVQSNFTEFKVNREVMEVLDDLEDMYDDLLRARQIFRQWDEERPYLLPEQEKEVKSFLKHFKNAYRAVQKAISHLDVTGNPSQFNDAKKAYNYDGQEKLNRYTKEVRDLINNLEGNSHYRSIYSKLLAVQEEIFGY